MVSPRVPTHSGRSRTHDAERCCPLLPCVYRSADRGSMSSLQSIQYANREIQNLYPLLLYATPLPWLQTNVKCVYYFVRCTVSRVQNRRGVSSLHVPQRVLLQKSDPECFPTMPRTELASCSPPKNKSHP